MFPCGDTHSLPVGTAPDAWVVFPVPLQATDEAFRRNKRPEIFHHKVAYKYQEHVPYLRQTPHFSAAELPIAPFARA